MANPLKVLTQLSASKQAQFADVVEMQKQVTLSGAEAHLKVTGGAEISGSGALKIAGAAQLGSSLDVKGAAALSSSLGVVGAADLQDILDVAGVANFASDVTASAGVDVGDILHVVGAVQLDATLDVDGVASFLSDISGAAGLDLSGSMYVGGAAELDSTLDVAGAANFASTLDVVGDFATQASASVAGDLDVDGDADVAGDIAVHGDAVIYGNLEVKGTMTTIESTTVTVADANIQLATVASPTDATADGAGITILGATNKTFQWNDDGHGFTSSEDMNLAAGKVYKIGGEQIAEIDTGDVVFGKSNSGDHPYLNLADASGIGLIADSETSITLDKAGNRDAIIRAHGDVRLIGAAVKIEDALSVYSGMSVTGSAVFGGAVDMDSTLVVDGVASFASDITASANVDIDGTLNVAGQVDLASTLFSTAGALFDGSLTVNGDDFQFNGLTADIASNLIVANEYASFSQDLTASAGLEVGGAAHFAAAVDMDSTLNVDGVASFASDITASAGLEVVGNALFSSLSFGGILDAWGTSYFHQPLIVDNGYFVGWANSERVYGDNGILRLESSGSVTSIQLNPDSSGMQLNGAVYMDSTLNVDGAADFQAAAAFHAGVAMDAALNLSGSDFVNINTPVVDGKYNVNDAIRALDAKVGEQGADINSNYAALRYLDSDFFDANGMAAFTSSFAAADIEQVSVDVLVQAGGSGPWTNDLLSVQVKAAGAYVGFEISAPAMGASDKVRIIAVKESGSLA